MIRLIVSDIDGTLVPEGGSLLNPEYMTVIRELTDRGVRFAAASGRQWASIEAVFEPIKEKIFYLSDNGSYLGCHGRNLFLNPIERDTAQELIKAIRQTPDLDILVGGPDVAYIESRNQEYINLLIHGYQFKVVQVEDISQVADQIIKISAYKPCRIQEATEGLMAQFGGKLKMAIAGDMWLDSMAPGVCKGHAIKTLQENLDIKPEETMAFGDQMNDMEMFERAYYSFAVANARDEVKKAARFQADSNEHDGVLKVLKQLL